MVGSACNPVIPATWKVAIRRTEVQSHLGQKVSETSTSRKKKSRCTPVILAVWEVYVGGSRSKAGPGQKV
jgi:hypothetical protein